MPNNQNKNKIKLYNPTSKNLISIFLYILRRETEADGKVYYVMERIKVTRESQTRFFYTPRKGKETYVRKEDLCRSSYDRPYAKCREDACAYVEYEENRKVKMALQKKQLAERNLKALANFKFQNGVDGK